MSLNSREGFAQNVFLGEKSGDRSFVKRVDETAVKVDSVLNPIDDAAKRKVVGDSIKLIRDLGFQADNIQTLENVLHDQNKTKPQKEIAETNLDVLAKATYVAMRYGKSEEVRADLCSGSVERINDRLPEPLKGLGERVRANIIDEPKIVEILDRLDKKRVRTEKAGGAGKVVLAEAISVSLKDLMDIDVDSTKEDQVGMVMAFLGAEVEGQTIVRQPAQGGGQQVDAAENMVITPLQQFNSASDKYWKKKERLEGEIEEISLGELEKAYLFIKAPRERAPQLWEYEVPKFMNGMSQEKWRKLLNFQDGWLGAIYDKRGDPNYNNSIDKMTGVILGKRSLEEGDLKEWYEDSTLNLKGVLHHISRELLTPKTITAEVPVFNDDTGVMTIEKKSKTVYVFDTVINSKGKEEYRQDSRVQDLVDNESNYKLALADRLVEKGVVKNVDAAKLAVALAMDIMEMGGVFSEADGMRKLSWESDVVRLAQRPERKFLLKVSGGELFAGPWTELANFMTGADPKKATELVRSWGVIPELLAGSFLDQKLYLAGGKKTERTMMEMIYNDEKIPFRDLGNDLFFSWRKDHIMTAARMWMYISNKNPLEFSRNRENDAVISQWRTDLYNDINQIRDNGDALLPSRVIAGAVGGSGGLWPFVGPYLRISGASHDNPALDNFEATSEVVRQLGLHSDERSEILRFFGVDKKNYNDFNTKIVAYTEVRNVTLPNWYKRNSESQMRKKRPV